MTNHHRTPKVQEDGKPTPKQQAYVRQLALQRGVSFTPPRTKAEASRLIDELKRRQPDSTTDRNRELRAVQAAMSTDRGGAARVRDHELEGHGSSATWAERS